MANNTIAHRVYEECEKETFDILAEKAGGERAKNGWHFPDGSFIREGASNGVFYIYSKFSEVS